MLLPHSGSWLNVTPSQALGLSLSSQEFKMVLSYRMGVAVYDKGSECVSCSKTLETLGDHAMN